MLYFAYGTNLDATQMRLRCSEARYVGKASLDDYRFCFPVWSRIRQSGLISVEPSAGDKVWGVLYELRAGDFDRLDQREGYDPGRPPSRNSFNRVWVKVTRAQGKPADAQTYIAQGGTEARLPSAAYIAYLLTLAGARDLPEEYQEKLRGVRTAGLAA
jgi:gamma-glutamylcyclotransferase